MGKHCGVGACLGSEVTVVLIRPNFDADDRHRSEREPEIMVRSSSDGLLNFVFAFSYPCLNSWKVPSE